MELVDHTLTLIEKTMVHSRSSIAVRYRSVSLTYADLDRLGDHAASALADAGVTAGDRVGLLLGNSPDHLAVEIAIMRLGAVKVPLNSMLPTADIEFIIDHCGAKCLVTNNELLAKVGEGLDSILGDCSVVNFGDGLYVDRRDTPAPHVKATPAGPDDMAAIYYTGGTTGAPKGVVHTHRSIAISMLAHLIEAEIRRNDSMLLVTPLAHAAGAFAVAGLVRGATLEVHDSYSVDALIDAVHDGRVTWAFMVPTMIYRLLDETSRRQDRLVGLDTIVYGASPITPSRLEEALATLDVGFIQLFGQTEFPNWGTTMSKHDHILALKDNSLLDSCGKASAMADVSIMEAGQVLDAGEVGEVCLRGPYAMRQYYDNPTATAETLVDGWVHTGDVGLLDEQGYLHLKDRKKDMIISGGMNVYTSEVEAVLQRLDGVSQVAVIGKPSDVWGESVCAFIVTEPGVTLDAATVDAYARENLATYKRPKDINIVDGIPLTAVGKHDKKALRARYWTGGDRQIS